MRNTALTILLAGGNRRAFRFQVVPTPGQTLSLAVERHNVALDAVTWVWPDGTMSTGDSVSKLFPVAGAQWVTLRVPQASNLRSINFASQPVRFSLAQVRRYTALQRIDAHNHASTVITGTLADLPATMQILYLHNTASVITGGGSVGATALRDLRINELGLSTAQVDEIINSIWASRNAFTYTSNIRLDIHGTNGAPTGTVANVCPPTTPAEKLYNLRHVQCGGDTHKPWSPITFTGGAL